MLEHLRLPQTHNHHTRKLRTDRSIKISSKRPLLRRARLTEKNLKTFGKMGIRARKSAGKKSTRQSSSRITTTDTKFGKKLQQNNIICTSFDAQAPDDVAEIRELLDQTRESEPPDSNGLRTIPYTY
jgi:hypothetical protein